MKNPSWLVKLIDENTQVNPMDYLSKNSRSFRYAIRFMPAAEAQNVAQVYAFCRFTDDLVDEAEGIEVQELEERLYVWEELSKQVYMGNKTGLEIMDGPISKMAEKNIPFEYVGQLIEGMRMDINPRPYANMSELETYTHRVAGVVGQWLTELVGVKNPWVLERANDLGHAMQLTNILRDVGEDLKRGRIYLPQDLLIKHGLHPENFSAEWGGQNVPPMNYQMLMEEMMETAEHYYRLAFLGIPSLPAFFQKPSLVSALVYREIHTALRKNNCDNFRFRAHSSSMAKFEIGIRAFWMLPFIRNLFPALKLANQETEIAFGN